MLQNWILLPGQYTKHLKENGTDPLIIIFLENAASVGEIINPIFPL